jgi:hypothetical protein
VQDWDWDWGWASGLVLPLEPVPDSEYRLALDSASALDSHLVWGSASGLVSDLARDLESDSAWAVRVSLAEPELLLDPASRLDSKLRFRLLPVCVAVANDDRVRRCASA